MEMNEESLKAWDIIEKTSANLFLTGKAGTGKTTFLQELKRRSPKRMEVLAPTGIAAINAGGVTIHSFFQLPPFALSSGYNLQQRRAGVGSLAFQGFQFHGRGGGQVPRDVQSKGRNQNDETPSGKLPISIEKKWEDNPCHDSYYENRPGRECKTVEYREGVFVGYRGYDANGVKPLFPFGFGLSYSSFDYSNLSVVKDNDSWLVSFDLKNTGKKDAAEVAQVYVGCVNPTLPRPLKELKGFEKVFLKHGESRRIQVKLDSDSFSYYDMDRHQFVTVPGSYLVQVGGSSVSLPLKEQILIP